MEYLEIIAVEDAIVNEPMETDESMSQGTYAWSPEAEEGTVVFDFTVACQDTYYVWGVVWDGWPGPNYGDPDSFYVRVDQGKEMQWIYGCKTGFLNMGAWTWQEVDHDPDAQNGCDDLEEQNWPLAPGKHSVTVRNREAPNMGRIAGIARVLITNDPEFVPDIMQR
jgi:hypothetical protein